MIRTEQQINTDISVITREFVDKYYQIATDLQHGVSFKDNFNVNNILLNSLNENAIFGTLSDQQFNNILDELIWTKE